MNIKVFKTGQTEDKIPTTNPSEAPDKTEKESMERPLSNGCKLIREGNTFFAAVGEERVQISREEAILILQNHDLIYDVIIEAKRKFYFNTAEDRYSPTEY